MAKVLLDLNLTPDLLLDFIVDNFGLVLTFESQDEMRLDLCSNHIHASELALPEWPANVKVMQTPFTGWS